MNLRFPKPQSFDRNSPWRYCKRKGKNCEDVFRIWPGSSTHCQPCWRERREERQAARTDQRKRPGSYPKPKPRFWGRKARKKKIEEAGARCEVCKMPEKECKEKFGVGLTRNHILAARYIQQRNWGDPHLDLNIQCICSECHGVVCAAEVKLFAGDVLGWVEHLRKFGWNMAELEMVLKYYGCFPRALEHLFRDGGINGRRN